MADQVAKQSADAEAPSAWAKRLARWRGVWEQSVPRRCVTRALEIQITDRMMALAAQAFLALMPLVIVLAAAAPQGVSDGLVDAMRTRAGLGDSDTTENVESIASSAAEAGVTAFGSLLVLLSATSFSRALQRVYERTWRVAPGGLRSAWRPLAWIVGMIAYFVLLGFTFKITHSGGPLTVIRVGIAVCGSIALWWWTPFVLLSGRVRWRALVPTALCTALGTMGLGVVSARYVPHLLSTNESRYGTIGVAFAIESWLVVLFAVVLAATVLGAVLVDTRGRLGVWARGAVEHDGWQRTPKSGKFAAWTEDAHGDGTDKTSDEARDGTPGQAPGEASGKAPETPADGEEDPGVAQR
ncbi:YhjD/YihY/BrkB family envelope integrity protein [Yinghuangia soli]|uniref:YihY/virulence factor BrkB family protein n=1 Tax=Yinghuangia soli TaxID=2908204 RepID=A0AA41U2M0_9ACTN|nr:YhjD/YihY/BrkB family envelope integrity protein [Yinghuangia soli]MCF2530836.1 YihY/virulence factor BrkB family protein [Yinghuangia soli]